MRASEAFRSALETLSAHKLRSSLTMLGMMFGVGAVISMLSIGAGAERRALSIIDKLGLRNVEGLAVMIAVAWFGYRPQMHHAD